MASKIMRRRVESILDATYRAWDLNETFAAEHPDREARDSARYWQTAYQCLQVLNTMVRQGRPDREINAAWEAVRTEIKISMTLPRYGMFVRAIYPAPRTAALMRIYSRELSTFMRAVRLQRRLDMSVLRLLDPTITAVPANAR